MKNLKWFVKESKSYIGYPKCGKLHFWLRFPKALIRFMYLQYKTKGEEYVASK